MNLNVFFIYRFLYFLCIYFRMYTFSYLNIGTFSCRLSLHTADFFLSLFNLTLKSRAVCCQSDDVKEIHLNSSFVSGGRDSESEWVRKRVMRAPPLWADQPADWLRAVSCHRSMIGGPLAAFGRNSVARVRESPTEDDAWTRSCGQSQTHPSWKSHPGRSVYTHD